MAIGESSGKGLTKEEKEIIDSFEIIDDGKSLKANKPVYIANLHTDPHTIYLGEQVEIKDAGSTITYDLRREPETSRSLLFSEFDSAGTKIEPRTIDAGATVWRKIVGYDSFSVSKTDVRFTREDTPTTDYFLRACYFKFDGKPTSKITIRHYEKIEDDEHLLRKIEFQPESGEFRYNDFAPVGSYANKKLLTIITSDEPFTLLGYGHPDAFAPWMAVDGQPITFREVAHTSDVGLIPSGPGFILSTGDYKEVPGDRSVDLSLNGIGPGAPGSHAFACNHGGQASGTCSFAAGYNTRAMNFCSTAFGAGVDAAYEEQFSCGHWNHNKSENLFEVGNGANGAQRSNALEVDRSGNINTLAKVNGMSIRHHGKANMISAHMTPGRYDVDQSTTGLPEGFLPEWTTTGVLDVIKNDNGGYFYQLTPTDYNTSDNTCSHKFVAYQDGSNLSPWQEIPYKKEVQQDFFFQAYTGTTTIMPNTEYPLPLSHKYGNLQLVTINENNAVEVVQAGIYEFNLMPNVEISTSLPNKLSRAFFYLQYFHFTTQEWRTINYTLGYTQSYTLSDGTKIIGRDNIVTRVPIHAGAKIRLICVVTEEESTLITYVGPFGYHIPAYSWSLTKLSGV